MIKDQCKHVWEVKDQGLDENLLRKYWFVCNKCHIKLPPADVFQYETLIYLQRIQTKLNLVTIFVSIIALGATLIFGFLPYLHNLEKEKNIESCWKTSLSIGNVDNTEKNYQACLRGHGIN